MKALIQSGEWQIYEKIPSENGMAKIFIEQTPVSPWGVVLRIAPAISSVGMIFALLLVIGSLVNLVVASGAVENLVDYRFKFRVPLLT